MAPKPPAVSGWFSDRLTPDEFAEFAAESSDRDLRRLRVLVPLFVLLHVAHILLYRVPVSGRAGMSADLLRWQDLLVANHLATLPLSLFVGIVAFVWPHSRLGRHLGPLAAAGYLLHGAIATGVDQIAFDNVAAYTGYAFGIAVVLGLSLRRGLVVYGLGFAALALALFEWQADPATRISNLLNASTVTLTSLVLGVLVDGARRRDFRQRRIIASQRDELAALNSDLERRVDEQVAEIVRRAGEVDQLNAQLSSQIRARSGELSVALSRLARLREEQGRLREGEVLGDRFEIGGAIGSGGMGVVHAARDRVTGNAVAIKAIRPSAAIDADTMQRFVGEARVVASITHPAVVRVVHVDVSDDGLLYQAQELVEGRTLESRLEDGAWGEADVARFGSVLCDALAAAHERGVIHRDIKPANVMLVEVAPGLKLLDFGLAKLHDGFADDSAHRTGSRLVVGTPAYMAPEQVLGAEVSGKADVYSCGVLLFHLLTGRPAFEADGASAVMNSHLSVEAPDLRGMGRGIAEELAALVSRCLAKDPASRPTASELGAGLRTFADAHGAPPLEELLRREAAAASPTPEVSSGRIARRFRN